MHLVIVFMLTVILFFLAAAALLYRGRKRRIGDAPHCRKCNYLLHGLESERCPECGAMLSPAAIVHGERRRRWGAFVTGWFLLLLAVFLFFGASIPALQTIDWYRFKPTSFVLLDLNSAQPTTAQRAWAEMIRRDATTRLSAATRDKLVHFALAQQAKAASPFIQLDTDAVNYLAARWAAGDLPQTQRDQFFRQSVRTKLAIRPKVILGERVPYLMIHDGLGPGSSSLWYRLSMRGTVLDGKPAEGNIGGSSACSGFGGGSFGSSLDCPSPGKHDVALTFRVEVLSGPFDSPSSALLLRDDRALTGTFQVVTKAPPEFIGPIFDPKLEPAMKAGIKAEDFRYEIKSKWINGQIDSSSLPANIAYEVFARYGGAEQSLGYITCNAGSGGSDYGVAASPKTPPPAKIDLVLRPGAKVARGTVDMQSFWNEEIVLPGVPVTSK